MANESNGTQDAAAAVGEFIRLTEKKRRLAEEQRGIQKRLDDLSGVITEDFHKHNRQAETRDGYCVYLSRDVSVKSATGETGDIVDKMRKARLGELIGLNWPKVKAWVKERMYNETTDTWEVDVSKLPPSLREVVTVEEFHRLNCRKAG